MKPTDILVHEHEVILEALGTLRELAGRIGASQQPPAEAAEALADFLASYADALHHGKEEKMLFPAMEEAGIPRHGGPIGVMLLEHERGRELVRTMRAQVPSWAEAEARQRYAEAALQFVDLLTQHIAKENQVLFPMGEQVLPAAERARLQEAFQAHDEERRSEFERCLGLLREARAALD